MKSLAYNLSGHFLKISLSGACWINPAGLFQSLWRMNFVYVYVKTIIKKKSFHFTVGNCKVFAF
jgi:hypothetical protein